MALERALGEPCTRWLLDSTASCWTVVGGGGWAACVELAPSAARHTLMRPAGRPPVTNRRTCSAGERAAYARQRRPVVFAALRGFASVTASRGPMRCPACGCAAALLDGAA